MTKATTANKQPTPPMTVPFHYGWIILGLTFFASLNGAGIRAVPAVLINPLEADFGWTRGEIASAVAINLFLYGAVSPLAGWLLDKYGPRRVMMSALTMISIGVAGTTMVTQLWQFLLLWGVVVGLGAGGMSGVMSASVAHRWFVGRRGIALGILNSGPSTGQIIFLPLMMWIIVMTDWRVGSYLLVSITATSIVLLWLFMRDEPSQVGLTPYNYGPGSVAPTEQQDAASREAAAPPAMGILDAVKTPTFWLLCGVYFVCGGTANGLIGTHLIPHTLDRGFDPTAAATTVGIMGGMNFVGTLLSGWLTDRVDSRKLLALVFVFRGSALFLLPFVDGLGGLMVFAIIYGLDWFASVPPVVTIAGQTFGKQSIGRVYGWIFLSHQVGAALMALGGGMVFSYFGDYQTAFFTGGFMGLLAAGFALSIRPREVQPPMSPEPAAA